jgi:hypothetical protein
MPREYKMYINGEWVDAFDRAMYDDYNPYTGEVFARVPSGKRGDARRAIEAAAAAFPAWSNTLPAERQALFLKAADILQKKQNEIVTILAEETGCTFGFAMFQTMFTPGLQPEAASQVHNPIGEIIPADLPGAFYMATRQPVGPRRAAGPIWRRKGQWLGPLWRPRRIGGIYGTPLDQYATHPATVSILNGFNIFGSDPFPPQPHLLPSLPAPVPTEGGAPRQQRRRA